MCWCERRTGGAEQRDAERRGMRRQGTRGGGGSYVAATMSAGAGVKSTNRIGRRASTTVAPCHVEKRDGTVEAAEAARRTPRAAAPDSVPTAVRRAAPPTDEGDELVLGHLAVQVHVQLRA